MYSDVYVITVKVGRIRLQTLVPSMRLRWKHRRKAPFEIIGCRVRFDGLHGCEMCPLEAQRSLGARSGE
jgi:hypothetical protein